MSAALPVHMLGEEEQPVGWLYDWIHSSALGKPDEHFTSFTPDQAYAMEHDNVRPVYAAPVAPVPEPTERVAVSGAVSNMTAARAAFFMERFKREEKLLGPNEQAAVEFVLELLAATPPQQATPTSAEVTCGRCGGSGDKEYLVGGGPDAYDEIGPCPDCQGTGAIATPAASTIAAAQPDDVQDAARYRLLRKHLIYAYRYGIKGVQEGLVIGPKAIDALDEACDAVIGAALATQAAPVDTKPAEAK